LTSVELSASPEGSQAGGDGVVLTATLDNQNATVSVQFFDGDASLGTAVVVEGAAVLPTSSLAVGEHSLTTRYLPDLAAGGTFVSSVSDAVVYWVTEPFLHAGPNPAVSGVGQVGATLTVHPGRWSPKGGAELPVVPFGGGDRGRHGQDLHTRGG